MIAEGSAQGGSNGVIGQFKSDLAFQRRPNQRLGVVEAATRTWQSGTRRISSTP